MGFSTKEVFRWLNESLSPPSSHPRAYKCSCLHTQPTEAPRAGTPGDQPRERQAAAEPPGDNLPDHTPPTDSQATRCLSHTLPQGSPVSRLDLNPSEKDHEHQKHDPGCGAGGGGALQESRGPPGLQKLLVPQPVLLPPGCRSHHALLPAALRGNRTPEGRGESLAGLGLFSHTERNERERRREMGWGKRCADGEGWGGK